MTRRLYDISQPLHPAMPIWPGDTPFALRRTWVMGPDCPVNVAALGLSTHAGSHADAPLHYDAAGIGIDAVDLDFYLGPAQLVDARQAGARIEADLILPQIAPGIARLLLRSYERAPRAAWDPHFKAVAPELVAALAKRGIRLIGIDTPSLDPQESKTMAAHGEIRRHGMAILEGLILDEVPLGIYELIALPLKIAGADAAPVRAILRSLAP